MLPALNLAAYCLIRFNGGAHGHAPVVTAALVAVEAVAIAWFCTRCTERQVLRWTVAGLVIDAVASVVAIYVLVFAILVISYAGKGGGD